MESPTQFVSKSEPVTTRNCTFILVRECHVLNVGLVRISILVVYIIIELMIVA